MNWKERMKNVDMIEFDTSASSSQNKIMWLIWASPIFQGKTFDFLLVDYIQIQNQYAMILLDESDVYWIAYIPPGREIIMTLAFPGHAVELHIDKNRLQRFKASVDQIASESELHELMQKFRTELEKVAKIRPQTYQKVLDALHEKDKENDAVDIP